MLGFTPLPRTLEASLRDSEHARPDVRLAALADLKRHAREGAAQALTKLLARLRNDPEPQVRAAAALALADIDAHDALDALVVATSDADGAVRQMALLGAGELAAPEHADACAAATRGLVDPLPAVRYQALVALARLRGFAALESLLVGTRDADPEVRHVAFRVAEEVFGGGSVEQAPPVLTQRARGALRDDDRAVQLAAAILLTVLGEAAGRERLIEMVNARQRIRHVEDEVIAIELCGELRLTSATLGLERRAFGWLGPRTPVSWHARVALAELGHPRAKSAILRGLSAWSRDARTLAVAAAGRARLAEAREILQRMVGVPERAEPDAVSEALTAINGASTSGGV
ncbi:MAG TPA: HEAT repeat domain-containing protein [Polyangiaceae bacterium]|nr:HEAT repeat domain-containing protein [Polyangiaceae bacterium]